MSESDSYYTVDKIATAECKDRGSKFIAYVFPVISSEEFKSCMASVKVEHPKATHHCFAYRIGLDGNNFRVNDDGEPSGSAGRPILGQIDNRQLTNTLIIVVRYFGGTLLGIPGLINAYKNAASFALQVTPVVLKQVEIKYRLQFDYTIMNDIMTIVKQYNCSILQQDLQLFCTMTIGIPKNRTAETINRLNDVRNVQVEKVL